MIKPATASFTAGATIGTAAPGLLTARYGLLLIIAIFFWYVSNPDYGLSAKGKLI